ncbi:uncharacterized protein L3040_002830 [Drepanopeziza brunnea f. sp. 'multigermtubi']|uniref:Uncharacterized protein n=1 Tax=Marssonina brunnea f. sp. multigermtubi (strain MB_m1) TaxID=1072389 RepID=K1XQA3_MARBU|nr:uncharacterized protein MBM_06955 [Drepanopeziza brunnea f. sp. 'multigermtubi' MB_m1]EKD14744.1 hypothetical protein MBM_06955 [Drepanopeziza brunnea f. sp. 'multigermtubi' MB_m1]KAJ5050963.1 hypothetical protein L3040_002830 [Drepanopeziza brunnea f. sp. 'multigermtubi']
MPSSYVSQWESTDPEPLTRDSLLGVLDGKIGCIREPNFVPPDIVARVEEELSPKLSPYHDIPGPTLHRVGVAQFEFQAISDEQLEERSGTGEEKLQYFAVAKSHANLHEDLEQKIGLNIWKAVIDKIAALLPDYEVAVAEEEPGQKYFSGIFRAINNSTPIHCDWSPYDSRTEDWLINQVTKQAVFNIYFTEPQGGKTEVHDCQWTDDALDWRDFSSYGYSADLVKGRKKVTIQPKPADLCIFNSRNMHQVFPVEPGADGKQRPRLTLSSFMGVLPARSAAERPRLILWS